MALQLHGHGYNQLANKQLAINKHPVTKGSNGVGSNGIANHEINEIITNFA